MNADELLRSDQLARRVGVIRVMFVKGRASDVAGAAEQWSFVSAYQEVESCQVGSEGGGVVGAVADEAVERGRAGGCGRCRATR